MSKGIGVDIVEIDRIKRLIDGNYSLSRLLTENEMKQMDIRPKPEEYFAGRFASKEATANAFGVGLSKCPPEYVEVLNRDDGSPYITLHGMAKQLMQEHF